MPGGIGEKMDFLKTHEKEINTIIDMALKEDIGPGDITTGMIVPQAAVIKGEFTAREAGVVAGLPLIKKIFSRLDREVKVVLKKKDGDRVKNGDMLAVVKGRARALMTGERVALNFLQRMSAVATATRGFVDVAKHYDVAILDTRKTTPNLRMLEKYAVRTGGGENHRMGLYDAVLIKDNHLMGLNLEKAMMELRRYLPKHVKIEIEADTLEMLEKTIKVKPDIIMLDNMPHDMLEKALSMIKNGACGAKVEISGGVNMKNIGDLARLKPDYISIGSITNSPRAIDINFHIVE